MSMHDKSPGQDRSKVDQILDLLLDALAERQEARQAKAKSGPASRLGSQGPASAEKDRPPVQPVATPAPQVPAVPPPRPEPPAAEVRRGEQVRPAVPPVKPATPPKPEPEPIKEDEEAKAPSRLPSINMGRTLARLLILVAVLVALANIPVNRYGVSLARILPDSASLIVRDGLVLKGSGPKIYRLEEGRLRWISSMDAFEHLGLTWADVQVVDDAFLDSFDEGRPIHVLLKCDTSPHVYRLEDQQKRWIKDLETFEAEGHTWEDVRTVSCDYLRSLPDGPPIPEDAGSPPEP